ncbi:tRNA lysidine(34) synthetase TilS [Desulfothermus sp.]
MKLIESLKELKPEDVHLVLDVKNFILDELHIPLKNKKIVLAVSGGADSIALLFIMNVLKKSLCFKIVVAHLDHRLRDVSQREKEFVEQLCKENKISFIAGSSKVAVYSKVRKIGIEEAARVIRYRFLEGVRIKTGSDFICTGHHLNDLAEDILMRLTRGVGWPSLGGMDAINFQKKIFRPLLLIPKKKLISLLNNYSIKWVEDESNYNLTYKRNRIRHKILPLLLEENPNFLKSMKNLWVLSQVDVEFYEKELNKLRNKEVINNGEICIKRNDFTKLSKAIRLRWYRDVLNRLGHNTSLFANLHNLDNSIVNYKGPRLIQFPGNKKVKVRKNMIIFFKDQ